MLAGGVREIQRVREREHQQVISSNWAIRDGKRFISLPKQYWKFHEKMLPSQHSSSLLNTANCFVLPNIMNFLWLFAIISQWKSAVCFIFYLLASLFSRLFSKSPASIILFHIQSKFNLFLLFIWNEFLM